MDEYIIILLGAKPLLSQKKMMEVAGFTAGWQCRFVAFPLPSAKNLDQTRNLRSAGALILCRSRNSLHVSRKDFYASLYVTLL